MKIWLAILVFTMAISINGLPTLAQESDSVAPADRGTIIPPTQEEYGIAGEERSWEDMEQYEREHPNPPVLKEIPFRPTMDPEKYKAEKDAANKRVREHQGAQPPVEEK